MNLRSRSSRATGRRHTASREDLTGQLFQLGLVLAPHVAGVVAAALALLGCSGPLLLSYATPLLQSTTGGFLRLGLRFRLFGVLILLSLLLGFGLFFIVATGLAISTKFFVFIAHAVVTARVAATQVDAVVSLFLDAARAGFGCSDFPRRTISRFEVTLLRFGRRLNVLAGRW